MITAFVENTLIETDRLAWHQSKLISYFSPLIMRTYWFLPKPSVNSEEEIRKYNQWFVDERPADSFVERERGGGGYID